MLRSSVFVLMASVSMSLAFCQISAADFSEIIVNGEFEEPVVPNTFFKFPNSQVPGWTNSSGKVELWASSAGGPPLGTDGNPAGQHLELSTDGSGEVTTQVVSIPSNTSGTAFFSFDGWARSGTQQINIELTGTTSAQIISTSFVVNDQSWSHFSTGPVAVVAGENVEVRFTYEGGDGGPHVDQVSLLVETCSTFEPQNILCELDSEELTGNYVLTGELTNLQDIPVNYILLPQNAVAPTGVELCFGDGSHVLSLEQPLNNGDSFSIGGVSNEDAIVIKNAQPGDEVCFVVVLADENVVECCAIEVCFEMPPCDCLQVDTRFDEIIDVVCNDDGTIDFSYTFQLTNLYGQDVYHTFLGALGGETFTPDYFDLVTLNSNLPLGQGQSVLMTTRITSAQPEALVSFLITLHLEDFSECCTRQHDVLAPECPKILKGDVNCDGVVNLLDIAPFIQVLSNREYDPKADINCDGEVNLLDVSPFVALLN